jgi:hypothetical protein
MIGIALALDASVCSGSGDFFRGLGTSRASLWAVIVGSQAVGLTDTALVTLLARRQRLGLQALWPVRRARSPVSPSSPPDERP